MDSINKVEESVTFMLNMIKEFLLYAPIIFGWTHIFLGQFATNQYVEIFKANPDVAISGPIYSSLLITCVFIFCKILFLGKDKHK